jgi:hypothetical protein
MVDWFEFLRTIATFVASGAAVLVTWQLGKTQAQIARTQADTAQAQRQIAESQRDIAFDKLKHDLFDKRYEIYQAAKAIIEAILKDDTAILALDPELKKLRVKLGEARFFFPSDIQALCEDIEKEANVYFSASLAVSGFSENHPKHHEYRETQTKAVEALDGIYQELAQRFERDLSFATISGREIVEA